MPYAFIASGGQIGLLLVGSFGSWVGHTYKWDLLFELIGLASFLWIIFLYKMNREYTKGYKYSNLGPSATKGTFIKIVSHDEYLISMLRFF